VPQANLASARVAAKAGAVFEGKLRSRLFLHGSSHDALMYSIILARNCESAGSPPEVARAATARK
jgi:hypothetical protein